MKNLIILCNLLLGIACYSQNDSIAKWEVGFEGAHNFSVGNNFMQKSFASGSGVGFVMQHNFRRFFVGYQFHKTRHNVIDKSTFGNFDSGVNEAQNYFVGFRNKLRYKNMYTEHYIGAGTKTLYSYSAISKYKLDGTNFLVGSRLNYVVSRVFTASAGVNVDYVKYKTIIDGPLKDFYSQAFAVTPYITAKVCFGKKRRM